MFSFERSYDQLRAIEYIDNGNGTDVRDDDTASGTFEIELDSTSSQQVQAGEYLASLDYFDGDNFLSLGLDRDQVADRTVMEIQFLGRDADGIEKNLTVVESSFSRTFAALGTSAPPSVSDLVYEYKPDEIDSGENFSLSFARTPTGGLSLSNLGVFGDYFDEGNNLADFLSARGADSEDVNAFAAFSSFSLIAPTDFKPTTLKVVASSWFTEPSVQVLEGLRLSFNTPVVPEPSSALVWGMMGLFAVCRRRR